jgi:Cof subfamily protein (haloacid dehalogenase superfamily)
MLMNLRPRPPSTIIAAVVSDVDGTLVTEDKSLPPRAQATVARLGANGIAFTVISSRPPRGLRMLIDSLGITRPIAGFNGGVLSAPNLSVIEQHLLPPEVAQRAVHLITAHGAQSWVFSGQDWLVRDILGSYVGLEQHTVRFPPIVVENFGSALFAAAKIVAVSEDFDLLTRLEQDARAILARGATVARSQPYYVDFTHPLANKGAALTGLAKLLAVAPAQIAVIGDGDNDVAMFERSGLSIAMGNAGPQVQRAADFVTDRNSEDGFAKAIEWFILGGNRSNAAAPRPAAGPHNGVEAAGEGDLAW